MKRYEPDIPLPEYAFVPGINARPKLEVRFDSAETAMRRAVDLFNHGFYWEAHEVWEELWNAQGRTGEAADLLKGLIHLAASGVKARQNSLHGTATHAEKAAVLFKGVGEDLGIASLSELTEQVREVRQTPKRFLTSSRENVVIVFDFQVELSRG